MLDATAPFKGGTAAFDERRAGRVLGVIFLEMGLDDGHQDLCARFEPGRVGEGIADVSTPDVSLSSLNGALGGM